MHGGIGKNLENHAYDAQDRGGEADGGGGHA
jgi:hypothetical protein